MPFLKENFEVLISSTGGVGSTSFMNFVSKYKTVNPNHFKAGESLYKHRQYPPKLPWIKRGVFMVGNIYNAVLSLFDDEIRNGIEVINGIHLANKGLVKPEHANLMRIPREEYFKRKNDWYNFDKQITNWKYRNTNYPRLIIRSERMWDHIEEILDFLEIPKSEKNNFPSKRKRKSDYNNSKYKDALLDMYEYVQVEIIDKLGDLYYVKPSNT